MRTQSRLFNFLLIIVAIIATSCNSDKDKNGTDPITLSYVDNGNVFDNETKHIIIDIFSSSLPMLINGGDGNYKIINNNEGILKYNFDDNVLIIQGIAFGTGSIKISDTSNNNYTLTITISGILPTTRDFVPFVYDDNMDADIKATLEEKMIFDFPKGAWEFDTEDGYLDVGKQYAARLYQTDDENSAYKEYTCNIIYTKDVPLQFTPFLLPAQLMSTSFLMQSDTEEFVVLICAPFNLDDGRLVKGYNTVTDVTHRYITEHPEIKKAYVIMSSYPVE